MNVLASESVRSVQRRDVARTTERTSRSGRITPPAAVGITALLGIYGVTFYASIDLFQKPSDDPYHMGYMLLGILNVIVLPALVLAAIARVGRAWLIGMPQPDVSLSQKIPLWIAFLLSLLSVPVWIGMANVKQQGLADDITAASDFSRTIWLAPSGFLIAYGLSLFVIVAFATAAWSNGAEQNARLMTAETA
jgi:hypothetical protein